MQGIRESRGAHGSDEASFFGNVLRHDGEAVYHNYFGQPLGIKANLKYRKKNTSLSKKTKEKLFAV